MSITNLERTERAHFDAMAGGYENNYGYNDAFTKYKISKKSEILIKYLKKIKWTRNTSILEIGCGTGAYSRPIAKKISNKIIAIDISPKIIEVAKSETRNINNLKYDVQSVYNLNFKSNSVDVVYGFYVLHHLDIAMTIEQLRKVLKSGGIAFFYEPNILNPVVLAIKSIPFLKKLVGDSPDEWGINPLRINTDWKGFRLLEVGITEFIPPFKFLGYKNLRFLDKLSTVLSKVPLLKYLGGSVYFFYEKI